MIHLDETIVEKKLKPQTNNSLFDELEFG